jgi:hypothetical protein
MCGSTIIQELSGQTYSYRFLGADRSDAPCSALKSFEVDYTSGDFLKARHDLHCSSFEFVPTLTVQEPY